MRRARGGPFLISSNVRSTRSASVGNCAYMVDEMRGATSASSGAGGVLYSSWTRAEARRGGQVSWLADNGAGVASPARAEGWLKVEMRLPQDGTSGTPGECAAAVSAKTFLNLAWLGLARLALAWAGWQTMHYWPVPVSLV